MLYNRQIIFKKAIIEENKRENQGVSSKWSNNTPTPEVLYTLVWKKTPFVKKCNP